MIYPVYSVRDMAANTFGQLMVESNEYTAIRGFKFAINGREGMMNFQPGDYDLFKIGEFDVEKGEFKPIMPELVVTGLSVYGNDK